MAWDLKLPRRSLDGAIIEASCLNIFLDRFTVNDGTDRLVWCDGKDNFSVKVCIKKIIKLRVRFHGVMKIDWDSIRRRGGPSKWASSHGF